MDGIHASNASMLQTKGDSEERDGNTSAGVVLRGSTSAGPVENNGSFDHTEGSTVGQSHQETDSSDASAGINKSANISVSKHPKPITTKTEKTDKLGNDKSALDKARGSLIIKPLLKSSNETNISAPMNYVRKGAKENDVTLSQLPNSVTPRQSPSHKVTPSESQSHSVKPRESQSHNVTPRESPRHKVTPHESPSHNGSPRESPSHKVTPRESPSNNVHRDLSTVNGPQQASVKRKELVKVAVSNVPNEVVVTQKAVARTSQSVDNARTSAACVANNSEAQVVRHDRKKVIRQALTASGVDEDAEYLLKACGSVVPHGKDELEGEGALKAVIIGRKTSSKGRGDARKEAATLTVMANDGHRDIRTAGSPRPSSQTVHGSARRRKVNAPEARIESVNGRVNTVVIRPVNRANQSGPHSNNIVRKDAWSDTMISSDNNKPRGTSLQLRSILKQGTPHTNNQDRSLAATRTASPTQRTTVTLHWRKRNKIIPDTSASTSPDLTTPRSSRSLVIQEPWIQDSFNLVGIEALIQQQTKRQEERYLQIQVERHQNWLLAREKAMNDRYPITGHLARHRERKIPTAIFTPVNRYSVPQVCERYLSRQGLKRRTTSGNERNEQMKRSISVGGNNKRNTPNQRPNTTIGLVKLR